MSPIVMIAGIPLGLIALSGMFCKSDKLRKGLIWFGGIYTVVQLVVLLYVLIAISST